MRARALLPLLLTLVLLSACIHEGRKPSAELPEKKEGKEVVQEEKKGEPVRETKNVSYRGVVKPAGISIYMEGTHRLSLSDGRFILLESSNIDLNGYVGEEVDAFGAIRPSIEGGAIVMRVESIKMVRKEEISSASSSEKGEEGTEVTPAPQGVRGIAEVEAPAKEEEAPPPSPAPKPSYDKEKVAAMAKEKFGSEHWTQEYCTSAIGFCVPIHRNWWYKSFQASIGDLWYVEVSNAPVLSIGDGPIGITLKTGDVRSIGARDTEVRTVGSQVLGFRAWSGNRHFEVSGPAELREPIQYITEHLRPSPAPE